ncbi:hypothetical protein HDU97_005584 [Phlyctochytrium planicorne]|nr:hypothetical protein HDU97_005584 [Phlyctochytrium planicorne]
MGISDGIQTRANPKGLGTSIRMSRPREGDGMVKSSSTAAMCGIKAIIMKTHTFIITTALPQRDLNGTSLMVSHPIRGPGKSFPFTALTSPIRIRTAMYPLPPPPPSTTSQDTPAPSYNRHDHQLTPPATAGIPSLSPVAYGSHRYEGRPEYPYPYHHEHPAYPPSPYPYPPSPSRYYHQQRPHPYPYPFHQRSFYDPYREGARSIDRPTTAGSEGPSTAENRRPSDAISHSSGSKRINADKEEFNVEKRRRRSEISEGGASDSKLSSHEKSAVSVANLLVSDLPYSSSTAEVTQSEMRSSPAPSALEAKEVPLPRRTDAIQTPEPEPSADEKSKSENRKRKTETLAALVEVASAVTDSLTTSKDTLSTSKETLSSFLPPLRKRKRSKTGSALSTGSGESSSSHQGNSKLYSCDWPGCGLSFARRQNMQCHMTSHTGERPHGCQIEGCQAKFRRKQDLYRHIRCVHDPNRADGASTSVASAAEKGSRYRERTYGSETRSTSPSSSDGGQ